MKPRLTKNVISGLKECVSLIQVELEAGDRGAFDLGNGGEGEEENVQKALTYLYALISEYEKTHKK